MHDRTLVYVSNVGTYGYRSFHKSRTNRLSVGLVRGKGHDRAIPFYNYNKPGAKISQGVVDSFWRQRMEGGIKGQFDCIVQFSETDFTPDLKNMTIPTLILHGDGDQIVPIADSALLAVKIAPRATLKVYPVHRTACARSMPTR